MNGALLRRCFLCQGVTTISHVRPSLLLQTPTTLVPSLSPLPSWLESDALGKLNITSRRRILGSCHQLKGNMGRHGKRQRHHSTRHGVGPLTHGPLVGEGTGELQEPPDEVMANTGTAMASGDVMTPSPSDVMSCKSPPLPLRQQLERLLQGCKWVGELDPLVKETMEEIVLIEAELNSNRKLKYRYDISEAEASYEGPVAQEVERRFRERYKKEEMTGEQSYNSFSSRHIARKLLVNLPPVCESCWLERPFCMCRRIHEASLPGNIFLWLYMHPKEFLINNNTGKVLWQVLGNSQVRLCVPGVKSQEEAMWQHLIEAGLESVWCLYPSKGAAMNTPRSIPIPSRVKVPSSSELQQTASLNFILVDGTWNTSKSMVMRLQEKLKHHKPDADLNFVELSEASPSVMHTLRLQPSKEKICTAAAASRLLRELSEREDLDSSILQKASTAIDSSLEALLQSLAQRRESNGLPGNRLEAAGLKGPRKAKNPTHPSNVKLVKTHAADASAGVLMSVKQRLVKPAE